MDTTDDSTEVNLKKNRESLLAKNKPSEGRVKVKWIEQISTEFKVIEITIIKS
jgi:hypothetical protein